MVLATETPTTGTGRDYTHLVRDYRVHGSLYTDPAVFVDEMKRIFTDGWVFVGHESEAPRRGFWYHYRSVMSGSATSGTAEGNGTAASNGSSPNGQG